MKEIETNMAQILDWATDIAVAEAMAWLQKNQPPLPPKWDEFYPRLARRVHERFLGATPIPEYEEFREVAKEMGIAAVAEAVEAEAKQCQRAQ